MSENLSIFRYNLIKNYILGNIMKILNMESFILEAGVQLPTTRDMSAYNGKAFKCVCGDIHNFESNMDFRNFMTNSINAKMIITCPNYPNMATIVKTKYKFLFFFDKFESLAGTKQ